MSKLVISHNDQGEIIGWRYEVDDDYEPGMGEIIAPDGCDHRELERYHVVDGELVEDPDYDPRSPTEQRLDALENAAGVGKDEPKRGIAHRLDELEDRIAALEELHA